MQLLPPAAVALPSGQLAHEVAPSSLKVPAGQTVQYGEPVSDAYLPPGHTVQFADPSAEYLAAEQSVHVAEPLVGACLPAVQFSHAAVRGVG